MLEEVVGFAPTISEKPGRRFHSSSHSTFPSSLISVFKYLLLPCLIVFSLEFSLVDAVHPFPNIIMPSQFGLDSLPSCTAMDPKLNYLPVIGILSHPGDGASGRLSNATNASYIAASYVKFVESAGARVIPLIYTEPLEVIFEVMKNCVPPFFYEYQGTIELKYLQKCCRSSIWSTECSSLEGGLKRVYTIPLLRRFLRLISSSAVRLFTRTLYLNSEAHFPNAV